jgi:signal transduction histidine kinase
MAADAPRRGEFISFRPCLRRDEPYLPAMRDAPKFTLPSLQWVVVGIGAFAIAGGVTTMIGWWTAIPRLTDWFGSGISMFPNTAFNAACSGAALIFASIGHRWCARIAALLAATITLLAAATLTQHVFAVDLGIDELLATVAWGNKAAMSPGRMGPPASLAFTLLGLALLLLTNRRATIRAIGPVLAIAVCVIAALSLMGYLLGADPLFAVARYTGIALQTASILFALALAVICSVPEAEPMRTLRGESAAGLLARRSLPFIVGVPILLGWAHIQGHRADWFDGAMGTSLLTLVIVVVFSALLMWWAGAVARHERALQESRAQEHARRLELEDLQRKLLLHAAELEATVAERTAKLCETVNELQSFSYSIAHDMRAPLRSMGLFAGLLAEEIAAGTLSPAAQDYTRRIIVGARRLDNLINDSLNYTKAALQEFPLQQVDLAKLVRGLVDTYPNLHADAAEIRIEDNLPTVLGNESLLTQCFSNLLGNAVKFVAPGVRPCARVRRDYNDGGVRIWVEDNGIGIPKHAQPRLFSMFQKLDNAYEGTGIGLAIVRKVVERMGGKVGVESEPERGSRFWVDLKIAPQAKKP